MSQPSEAGGGKGTIRIQAPRIEDRGDWIRVCYRVDGIGPPELWFDVDAAHGDFVAHASDSAVATLLAAAMEVGKDLVVQGPISARLHWHIGNTVIPVVRRQLPFLQPVRVLAEGGWNGNRSGGSAILTGFSCGVDAFSAIQDHLLRQDIRVEDRITHFVFSNVGQAGYGENAPVRAEERWQRVKRAAEELGLPILHVNSNAPEFYPPEYDARLNWIGALTLRNSAVPLLLQAGVRRFLFASSHSWRDVRVGPTEDMTEADPILLPALSTERVELSAVGTEYTRVEKTRAIAGMPNAQRYLDVCIMEGGDTNCSKCEKCLRTLLTLELLGQLHAFESRFDLGVYRLHRKGFIARVLAEREDLLHLEIQDLMDGSGAPLPASARTIAILLRIWRVVPHSLRRRLPGLGVVRILRAPPGS